MQAGREIKFRAWDGSKLICVVYPKSNYKFEVDWDGKFKLHTFHERQEITDEHGETWKQPIWETVENAVIMQFTGLYDKNGKEIYEGDVWLLQGSDTPRVIVWHRYGWWFQYPGSAVTKPVEWTEDGEIIGNIYENPELLEVGNDASRT